MIVNSKECIAADVDPKKILSIAKRLSRCGKELQAMGLEVFGGSGAGTIRQMEEGGMILADIDGHFDGGDGATREDANGFMRGESW